MPFIDGPSGPLECLVNGSGDPVTMFAHGFAGSISETRPFGSGVVGLRVFFHFRGHGESGDGPAPWTYASLAADVACVATTYEVNRGVGVSIGAGALLRAALERPAFERLVLVLPPAVDQPRTGRAVDRVESMAQRADEGDVEGLTELLLNEQPADVRDRRVVQMWARGQAQRLVTPPLREVMRRVPAEHPVEDRTALKAVACPVLLIGQEGDEAHPSSVVHELAEALPDARMQIFSAGGVLWNHRGEVRQLISGFLND